ncbi:PrpF domain-containing protein [Thalassospira povalilytica]|uniref:PrpF domain-containing protein n=1 Tax=Thalassospira povalilytica TaxID=732237 RepID=UPI001D18A943|nr:PrpF domain-containing protein [Thalassospira povalilytica]MCC4242083.1 hypothetical protein [Thalassospira povalilytica]
MNFEEIYSRLPLKIIRGGSSKGIFVRVEDLPDAGSDRDSVILRLFGSPDIRQIDGLGGADKLTSKLAVMGPPTRSDCDISYLFAQVGTEFPDVDWKSNCGNISSGAALFAALDRLGEKHGVQRKIAIEQANTGRRLLATVPLRGDDPALKGEYSIGGVPGTGPRIDLDFADFNGSCLNRGLFPSGKREEKLLLPDGTVLPVTIIDMANLSVLVQADKLNVDLSLSLNRLQEDRNLTHTLDQIREAVLIKLGMATPETATEIIRRSVNPLVQILAQPQAYCDLAGNTISVQSHDVLSRSYARGAFSKAFPGTGAIGTGVCAFIAGTVAEQYTRNLVCPTEIRIGHPSGCMSVEVSVSDTSAELHVLKASIGRTARVLMEGVAHLD